MRLTNKTIFVLMMSLDRMDILGSSFRHGLDWVTTLTHSIRRVVLFDPHHPGHETQVLKIVNPDDPGSLSGKTPTSTQDYTMAYTVTQEPSTMNNESSERIIATSEALTEGFEPVAAFVKNDTLIIEPMDFSEEDNRMHPDVYSEIPDLPTVKREKPEGNKGVFHIAVGAIGLSTIVTGVVLMSSFRERTHRPSILVSRGVQTI